MKRIEGYIMKILVEILICLVAGSSAIIEITSGIYLERLPNVSFYQTTRQVIFRVSKPQGILERLNCTEKFCQHNTYICSTILNYADYLRNIETFGNKFSNDDKILVDDGELFDYQLATRSHVKKTFSSDYEVSLLLSKVGSRDHVRIYEIIYPKIMFTNTPNVSCHDHKLIDLVLTETNLQYEMKRSIVNMCQIKRLQLDFLPMSSLDGILERISIDVNKNDYVLALSSSSPFYTMPLVECIVSRNNLLVGLHVPIVRKQLQGLHMRKVITPSYGWKNFTCSVTIPSFTVALVYSNLTWTILLSKCDPFHEELCFINEHYSEETLGISCVRQVLQGGSIKQLATVCPVSCRETGNDNQFLTPMGSNKVMVTHPKDHLKLRCPDTSYDLQVYRHIGALLVTIPCHCHFEDEEETIYAHYPCVDKKVEFSTKQIIPAEWITFKGLALPKWNKPSLHFDVLEDCLNEQWIVGQSPTTTTPTLTYFVILNFLLLMASTSITTYRQLRMRKSFVRRIALSTKQTVSILPMMVEEQARAQQEERKLPPRPTKLKWETEENYLQPTERKTSVTHTEAATPFQLSPWKGQKPRKSPSTPPIMYVPHPEGSRRSPTSEDTHYISMDQVM
uniref:Uncharacterized protein n=1 Tax=Photinus pyralis TaxID=7054 RepID=A0A1Y1MF12_PHOPY